MPKEIVSVIWCHQEILFVRLWLNLWLMYFSFSINRDVNKTKNYLWSSALLITTLAGHHECKTANKLFFWNQEQQKRESLKKAVPVLL